jgi:elongation factor G
MMLKSPRSGDMRLSGVFKMFGTEQRPAGSARAGDIVGLGRLEDARTADVLLNGAGGDPKAIPVPRASPLKPMYAFAVSAENRNDEVKMSGAFTKLIEEDPSLRFEQDPELRQSVLWGQGEMHLRVALDRLRSKYHVDIRGEVPETPYRETIRKSAEAHGRHKKQSGGHGQFGDCLVEVKPLKRGSGILFHETVTGGSIPKQYFSAVEAGARAALMRGPLGFPVVDVEVVLKDGSYHSVDSSDMAFQAAGRLAVDAALPQARPVLLEPILSVEISVPTDGLAKATQLIAARRGQILGYEPRPGWEGWDIVQALAPEAEMGELIVELRSATAGVGSYIQRFDHMAEVTGKLADHVVTERRRQAA